MADGILRTVAGNSLGREIPLGGDFVVGRSETGMGALDGDLEISRRHARFRRTEQGHVLVEDLGSTNGTLVNDLRIAGPHLLSNGDRVTLGKTVLRYEAAPARTDVHASPPQPPPAAAFAPAAAPAPAAVSAPSPQVQPARLVIPLALGALVALGLYVWATNLTPDYSTSLFGQTAAGTFPLKSWLGTALLGLAVLQVTTALWLYGKLGRSQPRRLGMVHRLTGVAAILVSLPIAYHCMYAYGFRSFDSRTAVHSIAGCFLYGAIVAKIAIVRSKRLPGFALPLAGGSVVTVIFVLWYSAALWYFNDSSVPLLSSKSASSPAPAPSSYPGGATTTPSAAPAAPSGAVGVTMKNIQFAPKQVTAKVGQTITWTNDDSEAHNVTAVGGATFRSTNFGKGGTYQYRPTAPGKVAYVCTLHPGMDATLTVTP
jgi:plastocyanin